MHFTDEFDKITQSDSLRGAARFIQQEVSDWRTTRKKIASRRWIWELLQNARDGSAGRPFSFKVSWKPSELLVTHTAGPFKLREIHAIVCGDTSKPERSTEFAGKFGKGFLVTHVISTEVRVEGVLQHSGAFRFAFLLSRGGSREDILKNIHECRDSLGVSKPSTDVSPTTQFTYLVNPTEDVRLHIEEALKSLKMHAPYLLAFAPELQEISVSIEGDRTATFATKSREPQDLQSVPAAAEMFVVKTPDGDRQVLKLTGEPLEDSRSEERQPAILAIELIDRVGGREIKSAVTTSLAKLFQDTPLYGTEDFDIPVVLNLPRNASVESDRSEPNLEDEYTRRSLTEALGLLPSVIRWAREKGIRRVHHLSEIGISEPQKNQDQRWRQLMEPVLARLLRSKTVETTDGRFLSPGEAVFPKSDWLEFQDSDLLLGTRNLLEARGEGTPSAETATDWEFILGKWETIDSSPVINRIGLQRIFGEIEKIGSISGLSKKYSHLAEEAKAQSYVHSAFSVASQYCDRHGIDVPTKMREASIILNQSGAFRQSIALSLDDGLDEALKDISEVVGTPLRERLVHPALTEGQCRKLVYELCGQRVMGTDSAVSGLINTVESSSGEFPEGTREEGVKKAAVMLLVWLAKNSSALDYDLRPFPLLCVDGKLHSAHQMRDSFLLPGNMFTEGERRWLELFPESIRLNSAYIDACKELRLSQADLAAYLAMKGIGYGAMSYREKKTPDSETLSILYAESGPLSGHTTGSVDLSTVPGLSRLLSEVGGASSSGEYDRARKVLEFVLSYLVQEDNSWRVPVHVACESRHSCSGDFQLFPCDWLVKLKTMRWVPSDSQDNRCEPLGSQNVGRMRGGIPARVVGSPHARKFLSRHFGVNSLELAIYAKADGDPEKEDQLRDQLAAVVDSVQLDELEDLNEYVRRKRANRELRKRNQKIGHAVEELIKQAFKNEGFEVERTGKGSDFQVWIPNGIDANLDQQNVGLLRFTASYKNNGASFLVEVKSSREDYVRMSWKQADTATKNADRYVLCVLDLREAPDLVESILSDSPVLTEDVSSHLALVPEIGHLLANPVDGVSTMIKCQEPGIVVEKTDQLCFRIRDDVWSGGTALGEWVKHVREQLESQLAL